MDNEAVPMAIRIAERIIDLMPKVAAATFLPWYYSPSAQDSNSRRAAAAGKGRQTRHSCFDIIPVNRPLRVCPYARLAVSACTYQGARSRYATLPVAIPRIRHAAIPE